MDNPSDSGLGAPAKRRLEGTRLGPYQLTALIGAGGMGEVYRARDTRLARDVAIKVLPSIFNAEPERLARFEREARMLAALNHPHIGAIYGVEETDGIRGLVLELVEGETLAGRIDRLRMAAPRSRPALTNSIAIARQVAQALDAAHERGIIHRDLKPANVKITPAGVVKVLDFGLAKTASGDGALDQDASQSTTLGIGATREGVILGTAAYMSPEQARGQLIDKRTDIWAFGCLLYELLSLRPAFARATLSDTIAAVLEREPDWQALPTGTPPTIRHVIRRCLEKDASKRPRDIGDVGIELDAAVAAPPPAASLHSHFGAAQRWVAGATIGIAVGGAVLYVLSLRSHDGRQNDPLPLRTTFTQITSQPGVEWFPSLSPDGKWIVYSGVATGNRDIYLQSVNGQMPINLTADSLDDDDQPAFSPDGERIAFRSSREGGGIFVMGRTGESVRRVTQTGFKPAWSPDGASLAYTTENVELNPQNSQGQSELWVVNLMSGEQKRLSAGDAVLAHWSPHGVRIATTQRLGNGRQRHIRTTSVATGESSVVTSGAATDWGAIWAPDGKSLYFASDRSGIMNLWRVAVDEASGQALGEPEPMTTPAPFLSHPTISADGSRIAYSSVLQSRNIQKLALDPQRGYAKGDEVWLTTGSRSWANPDPSPDGRSIAFYSSPGPQENIFVVRPDGTGLRQVTNNAAVIDRVPRWSRDGNWLAYFSNQSGTYQLWKIHPDGSGLQQLTEAADDVRYPVWAPDGQRMAVTVIGKTPDAGQVFILNPNRPWKEQTPELLPSLDNPRLLFVVNAWSPNGESLVGQAGLVPQGIVTYSLRTGAFNRLTDFGEFPVWLPDSRRVLFVSGGKEFFVVDSQSRQAEKIFSVTNDVLGPPQLTRDGREAYYSRRVTEADIWLLATESYSRDK